MQGLRRVLVMEPTLVGVRDALRLLALPNGPLQVHRGLPVLNRPSDPELTRQQIEDALKMKVDIIIPICRSSLRCGKRRRTGRDEHEVLQRDHCAGSPGGSRIPGRQRARHSSAASTQRGWRHRWPFGR